MKEKETDRRISRDRDKRTRYSSCLQLDKNIILSKVSKMSKAAKKKNRKGKQDSSDDDDGLLAVDIDADSRCGGDTWICDR